MSEMEERPIIIIENDEPKAPRKWATVIFTAGVTVLLCVLAVTGYWYYRTYVNIGIPVSVKSQENIDKLQGPPKRRHAEVRMTSDTILGVGMNFYELRGLKGEITFEEPDPKDRDVYLYSRCNDFTSYDKEDCRYIGSLVVNGKEIESDNSRLGYCAMVGDNTVIGVSRDEKVMDYCIENGGSYFRQFVLVSNGALPHDFELHGKVERRAIGRIGDKLYYIETHDKEVMYAFADALREYGFVDAIYITGGKDYGFYRTRDKKTHDIGDPEKRNHKGKGIVPWVVFKRR